MKVSLPNSNHKRTLYHNIKYWSASGSDFSPSLIPALQNIGILHHKKAELRILLQQSVGGFEALSGLNYLNQHYNITDLNDLNSLIGLKK